MSGHIWSLTATSAAPAAAAVAQPVDPRHSEAAAADWDMLGGDAAFAQKIANRESVIDEATLTQTPARLQAERHANSTTL